MAEPSAADAAAQQEGPGPGPARSHSVLPVSEHQGGTGILRVQTRRVSTDEHTLGSPSTSSFREQHGGGGTSACTTPKSPASAFSGSSESRAEKEGDKKEKEKDSKMSRWALEPCAQVGACGRAHRAACMHHADCGCLCRMRRSHMHAHMHGWHRKPAPTERQRHAGRYSDSSTYPAPSI